MPVHELFYYISEDIDPYFMKRALITVIAIILCTAAGAQSPSFYNVRDFGAAGDGTAIDSPAINSAIDAASQAGGGTIYFPAGTYMSYSVRLKDNITLYLDSGAVLKAAKATAEAGYDEAEPNDSAYQDFGHSHWHNSLIWGEGLHDVSIVGQGLIDGSDGLSRGLGRVEAIAWANKAIALKECRNVTIKDISMLMCGHFALLLTGVDNLTIDNVRVDTNRDAFDIDCCANVRISNCLVNSLNDDGIVLKSSWALGYLKCTENVTITNCQVSGYDPGSMLAGTFTKNITAAPDRDGPTGRIKFGTESNGGFRNITISNCVFDHCRGLALETVDGAVIEDITIDNIAMRDIVNSPFYIRLGNRHRAPDGLPFSTVRRVRISNVTVKDADCRYASIIMGLEGHNIEDVTLSGIHIQYKGGLTMEDVKQQTPANSFFNRGKTGREDPYDVPQMADGYPEPSSHGILPAYGLYISHARNISIEDVKLETIEPDGRPAIVLQDVEGIRLHNMSVQLSDGAAPIVVNKVKSLEIKDFEGLKDSVVKASDTLRTLR